MTTEDPQKIKARLNDVAADVHDVYQDAVCCINELQAENRELQAERDEFKDAAFRIKRRLNAKTPRVITADELKVGQVVALIGKTGVFQTAGKFTGWKQGLGFTWFTVKTGRRGDDQVAYKDTDTIVLLADAPDEQQEPERLTVADLEDAPVGSILTGALFGADTYCTLTGAEWDETRETVARTLMERADLVNLGAAGDWYTAGHTIKEDFRGHADAAMRALGFKREGE